MLCNLYRVNKQITKNIISNVEKRDFNGFIEVSFLLGMITYLFVYDRLIDRKTLYLLDLTMYVSISLYITVVTCY
ncbi:hypothetical protein HMPREF0874_01149 [Veillonella sp. 6_1_27]|nr:hypothetical protein HMPREF0874_01149 [Veillonella sp. 6_1_27]